VRIVREVRFVLQRAFGKSFFRKALFGSLASCQGRSSVLPQQAFGPASTGVRFELPRRLFSVRWRRARVVIRFTPTSVR
jgi:hypothetical protein